MESFEEDEELKSIRIEARNMAQEKEVQNVLMQERFERMDWVSYGNAQKKEGEAIGRKEGGW